MALALLTGFLALQIYSLQRSLKWVDHCDVVIAKISGLLRTIVDEETGLRGYLLTREPIFLEPYNLGRSRISAQFDELQGLLADRPTLLQQLQVLRQEQSDWSAMAARRIDTQGTPAQLVKDALEGKPHMDHIRQLAAELLDQEKQMRNEGESRAALLSTATIAAFAVAGLLLAGFFTFYTRGLQRSNERFRALLDSMDEGFCVVQMIFDPSGKPVDYRFLETNQAFDQQTGLHDATGKTMREFAPEHEQYWFDIYGRIAESGESLRFQRRATQLDRWFDVCAFRFGQARRRQVAILFRDISLRKQLDEALSESERRFRAIYERAPVGIEQVAPDGRLLMVNSTQCVMLGYTEAEMLSMTFEDITHPSDRAREAALLEKLLAGEQNSYSLEKRYVCKDGSPVWVNISSTAVRDHSGALDYRITVVEDITARKRAEQTLIRSEKLAVAGRMASVMAHEINNPLAAALNATYLVSLDANLSGQAREYLHLISRELERMAHITKQTLGFYRETGKPALVKLPDLAGEVVAMFGPKLKNKDIRVEQEYRSQEPIYAIEGEVRQVLSNLVSNSIDAVHAQGCIRLRVLPFTANGNRPCVRLTVSDNGSGIEASQMKHIFEPFFSTKEDTGTGLGLWITQQLVRKHEGKIRARSRSGKGTVFQVLFPLERRTADRLAKNDDQELNAVA